MKSGNVVAYCLLVLPLLGWLAACSDGSDRPTVSVSEATILLQQFGDGAPLFSEAGMQALLDIEDVSSPVTLLQIMSVSDQDGFSRYESDMTGVLNRAGAQVTFASRIVGQLIGDRELTEVRAIEFPNTMMFIDALRSSEFAAAMQILFASTGDQTWTLGRRESIPLSFTESYVDPVLQNINRSDAVDLLEDRGWGETDPDSSLAVDADLIIDMIVSDSPEPFYMVNLIDYYELAHYPDGRESTLTGLQVNDIYARSIAPALFAHKSGPSLLLTVEVALTRESVEWERAAIVRYASRDAFLNIFPLNPDAADAVIHKEASVENTLVYVSEERHFSPPEPVAGYLFNLRYCEILLVTLDAGLSVDVYGTQGLNLCPQGLWDAIDRSSVAADFGVTAAIFNGPRFFVVDWISNTEGLAGGDSVYFGDLEMHKLTTVIPAAGAAAGESFYKINRVVRDNVWHFVAGRRIYELQDPEGERYIMQAFSRAVDSSLELSDLMSLGERLELPPGWQFGSRVLTETLALPAVNGIAEVVQDNLENTYQRVP